MNIVGISGGFGHDPASCLVRDGQLVAAAEEERFVRRKHAFELPAVHSLLYCVSAGGIDLSDVDYIAFSWDPVQDTESRLPADRAQSLLNHPAIRGRHRAEPVYVDHHLSHAASSYYASGLPDAGVVVADGRGEAASTTLLTGRGNSLTPVTSFGINHSLGFFYESASAFAGLGVGLDGPGKLMGLAAYGSPVYDFPEIAIKTDGYHMPVALPERLGDGGGRDEIIDQWLALFGREFGQPVPATLALDPVEGRLRNTADLVTATNADMAASVQQALQRVMAHLAGIACARANSGNLVLAGGVALNCSVNGKLRDSGRFTDLYVFPAAGDAGGAVGAAFEIAARCGEPPPGRIEHASWGPRYDPATIADVLHGCGTGFERPDEIWAATGELLLAGQIGGWFQGGAEFGPRALGNRSILALPSAKRLADRVNRCKGREPWRPLAPSMTQQAAAAALGVVHQTPFMLEAALVRREWATQLAGVTHTDGSTRPQTVGQPADPAYRKLLDWLAGATGIGAVLNTSFNVAGEPIVCTPRDAIRSFHASDLDFLAIGPLLLRKDQAVRKGRRPRC